MSSPSKLLRLKSSVLGGLKSFQQWSLGALFDPSLCKESVVGLAEGRGSSNTSTLDQLMKHHASGNVDRSLALDRMRTTCKLQALEKAVLVASVTHNFVVLEVSGG